MPIPDGARPTVADVGALLRERTRDEDGQILATFTIATVPTADEVDAVIARTLALLTPRLGSIGESMVDTARAIFTLHAATGVEATHFSQDVEDERGLYTTYRDELTDALKAWDAHEDENTPGQRVPRVASVPQGSLLSLASKTP